jgi:lactate dehydrogenase-like 2-hydroxyacid dehydrogenase
MSEQTLGVVGLGGIGSEVVHRGHALGMHVLAVNAKRRDTPEYLAEMWGSDRLDQPSGQMIRITVERMRLSARAYHRILKLARTSAGLAGEEAIHPLDLAQALPYRPRTQL